MPSVGFATSQSTGHQAHNLGCLTLIATIITAAASQQAFAQQANPSVGTPDRRDALERVLQTCPAISGFIKSYGSLEQIANPVIATAAEADSIWRSYVESHDCLERAGARFGGLSNPLEPITNSLQYFIDFGGTGRHLVDFATTDDPPVVLLRNKVRLRAPPGVALVRFYGAKEQMPPFVRAAFDDEATVGATLLSRYVAILVYIGHGANRTMLTSEVLSKTLSHEFVHAYINGLFPVAAPNSLPRWFNEGVAIYLSGSQNRHPETIGTQNGKEFVIRDPKDYEEFGFEFDYLASKLGEERLYDLIKQTIETRSDRAILAAAGVSSISELATRARAARSTRDTIATGIFVLFSVFVAVWIVRWFRKVEVPKSGVPTLENGTRARSARSQKLQEVTIIALLVLFGGAALVFGWLFVSSGRFRAALNAELRRELNNLNGLQE